MEELNFLNKFNRAIFLAMIDNGDIASAVLLYRQYSNYLEQSGFEKELKITKKEVFKKLLLFVQNNENTSSNLNLLTAYQELLVLCEESPFLYSNCAKCFKKLHQDDIADEMLKKASEMSSNGIIHK